MPAKKYTHPEPTPTPEEFNEMPDRANYKVMVDGPITPKTIAAMKYCLKTCSCLQHGGQIVGVEVLNAMIEKGWVDKDVKTTWGIGKENLILINYDIGTTPHTIKIVRNGWNDFRKGWDAALKYQEKQHRSKKEK